jgi:restriction system protein
MMRNYFQVRLGKANKYAAECRAGGYIGVGWFGNISLQKSLDSASDWKTFNREMIPLHIATNPETKKVATRLFCGFTYTVCTGLTLGDIVSSPIYAYA